MPECHKCRWNSAAPSPEKEAACLSCELPENYTNHKGRVFVSVDSGDSPQKAAEVEAALQRQVQPDEALIDEDDPATRAAMELGALRVILYFRDLDPADLSLLMMTLCQSLAETGRQTGRTRQAVSAAFRRIVGRHPELGRIVGGGH